MMWWSDWGWGAWLAMSLMMLAFWGLVAWLVVALVRGPGRDGWWGRSESARDVLDERFAKGEIDENEYRQRRELLSSR